MEDPENSTQNGNQKDLEQENEEGERKSVASEQTGNTPTTEQSEVGESREIESATGEKRGGRQRTQERVKRRGISERRKSRPEYSHSRSSSQEQNKQQRLNIPEGGKSRPTTPVSSDIVSNISLSPSGRSIAPTIEVPIDTATTAVQTADVGEKPDETTTVKKRERSPSHGSKENEKAAEKEKRKRISTRPNSDAGGRKARAMTSEEKGEGGEGSSRKGEDATGE